MSPEVSDFLKRALALSADERAALANTLLDSLEIGSESVEEAWNQEVVRRYGRSQSRKSSDRPLGTTVANSWPL
jgi:putative addiction module component (TIGR02574 family)